MRKVLKAALALTATLASTALAGEMPVAISGTVIDAAGAPVKGAVVSSLSEVARTDEAGRFTLRQVERSHVARINFRVTNDFNTVIGCAFVELPVDLQPVGAALESASAVTVVDTKTDVEGVKLVLKEVSAEESEEFCAKCHLQNPCLTKADEGGDWRTVTVMRGLVVKEREFPALKEKLLAEGIKPDLYPSLRYQDSHPQSMTMKEFADETAAKPQFRMPESLELTKAGKVVCDTCHTRHTLTEFGVFLKMEALEQPLLCRQCHL